MDTQIWYSIFSTICGGFSGAFGRLGEVKISSYFSVASFQNSVIGNLEFVTTDTNIRHASIPISIIARSLQHVLGAIRKTSEKRILSLQTLCRGTIDRIDDN